LNSFYISLRFSRTLLIVVLASLFFPAGLFAQTDSLKTILQNIIKPYAAKIGIAVKHFEENKTTIVNGTAHYPMQSVFKFPLAMAVLAQVDKGIFSLEHKIHIAKTDLKPNTWSPLREKYPDGEVDITLADLLRYTVSQSDNNGCDILFRLMGGTKKVNAFIHKQGVNNMAIVATEEEMAKSWKVQYTNWAEPAAMLQLLSLLHNKQVLSEASNDFLVKIMTETSTGVNRIKGQLPAGTVVAHKTGSSDTNSSGITAATNDAGIVTLPNGQHFAIVVFVSNAVQMEEKKREAIIAEIAKAVWDYYQK
jgi:beta-lactamase class A